jgi:cysteine sulfinate desulfinase/cysteine desulfurase-like protein
MPSATPPAHRGARAARKVIDEARDVMAAALGCAPGEVVFTSGGTEADNLAVAGWSAATGGTSSARRSSTTPCSTRSLAARWAPWRRPRWGASTSTRWPSALDDRSRWSR